MGDWKVIIPEETTNLCTNPSFEAGSLDWGTGGTNTATQSSAQSKVGVYSLLCTYQDNPDMGSFAITLPLANETYFISCWIFVDSNFDGTALEINESVFAGSTLTVIQAWDGVTTDEWVKLISQLDVVADAAGRIFIDVSGPPTAGRFLYMDGFLIERQDDGYTTYCDGDQAGCWWNGTPHDSTSTRSAVYRGGGLIKDLKDDYGFAVETAIGVGMPPVTLSHDSYSLLPGGELNGVKTEIRPFTLTGNIKGTGSGCGIHPPRNVLEKIFAHDAYPKSGDGWQPIRLRYTGAAVTKDADVHYARGLGGSLSPRALSSGVEKPVAIGFEQPAVFWAGIGDGSQVLDTNDSAAVRYIVARFKSTGQWNNMSVGAGGATAFDIAVGPDAKIYASGGWATIDGVANTSRIAAYDPQTGIWAPLQNGATDGSIVTMIFGADGTLYVGGTFTSMDNGGGPVANTARIASWDGTNWAALGTGAANNAVGRIDFDLGGNLIAVGSFLSMGGVANTDGIASWDGAAWNSISSGLLPTPAGAINALAIGPNNTIYVGGNFTDIGGVTVNGVAYLPSGGVWTEMGGGFTVGATSCSSIAVNESGDVFAGGSFTDIGADSVSYIAKWNGVAWTALGAGVDNAVQRIEVAPDGIVFVGGSFSEAGGITLAQRAARWNGSSWAHLDIDLPATPTVMSFAFGIADPVLSSSYDVFIGFTTAGTAYFAGLATTTNDGNTPVYPTLVVNRSGGTTAILETLRNESTGLELMLDYSLLDGETLTIDLDPQAKTIISSMFGSRPDAMLAGSDFGEWALLPGNDGDNEVTCFVSTSGGPTVLAYLLWPRLFKGID